MHRPVTSRPCPPSCAKIPNTRSDFECAEDPAINNRLKSVLQEAIKTSNESTVWDRTVLAAIKKEFPGHAIISYPGDLSSFKNLNTYEVKILIGDKTHTHRVIECKATVNYTINQEHNTRKVTFLP